MPGSCPFMADRSAGVRGAGTAATIKKKQLYHAWRHSGVGGGDPLGTSATVEPRLGLAWVDCWPPPQPLGSTEKAALAPPPRRGDRLPPVRLVWVLAHAIASKTPA